MKLKMPTVTNSPDKAVGISLGLEDITKAEPFSSLFEIKSETLEAIKADMRANGFDPSKPVNVWKTAEGKRILIDGYTRIRAAEELGLLSITAYEKTFKDEAEAMAYAVHTQRDRRNLTDKERLHFVELFDEKKERGGAMGPRGPIEGRSAAITAEALGTSESTVKRARVVLADPAEALAVRSGAKTINQAAKDAKAKTQAKAEKPKGRGAAPDPERLADARRMAEDALELLEHLAKSYPLAAQRPTWKAAAAIVRKALK